MERPGDVLGICDSRGSSEWRGRIWEEYYSLWKGTGMSLNTIGLGQDGNSSSFSARRSQNWDLRAEKLDKLSNARNRTNLRFARTVYVVKADSTRRIIFACLSIVPAAKGAYDTLEVP